MNEKAQWVHVSDAERRELDAYIRGRLDAEKNQENAWAEVRSAMLLVWCIIRKFPDHQVRISRIEQLAKYSGEIKTYEDPQTDETVYVALEAKR